ncbi:hypothetical protein [Xenorhabdus sp. KK7.4]|uniref:hypothetical protein n=1 Tax=Xenorhabdus sp. KK7.4 TaxID=1851572 RepID=UPI000C03B612|nr:hypothetical protein [Xenorhabdus sp. KK7.4]PHM52728.1 hypothetical protein Xekk_03027 [Xenorhabdus sp. KK7.4]
MRPNNIFKIIVFLLICQTGSVYAYYSCPPGHYAMQGYVGNILYFDDYQTILFTLTNQPGFYIKLNRSDGKITDEQKKIALNLLIDARDNDHIVNVTCKNGVAEYIYTYQ